MASSSEFGFDNVGRLRCERVDLAELQRTLCFHNDDAPFVVYSRAQILKNAESYLGGWRQTPDDGSQQQVKFRVGYALKANFGPWLLRIFRDLGLGAVVVSGNELRLALREGFAPETIFFNGNGKQRWERKLALETGCFLNVDSARDAALTADLARELGVGARVLVRVNPEVLRVPSDVHAFNRTANARSKFGVALKHLDEVLEIVGNSSGSVDLVGLHCHLGSTIKDVSVLVENLRFLMKLGEKLRSAGHGKLTMLNVGGGLGIDYAHAASTGGGGGGDGDGVPTAADLVAAIRAEPGVGSWELVLEPGRSLVGNCAMVVGRVLDVKRGARDDKTEFVVTNVGMNDVIRPCLYDAYHRVTLLEQQEPAAESHDDGGDEGGEQQTLFDVVGPICECGDFLAKGRRMGRRRPEPGLGIAVWDVGAYCGSMASNYNMRPGLAEVLVDGGAWTLVRRAQSFDELVRTYDELTGPATETAL